MTAKLFHPDDFSDLHRRAEEKFRAAEAKPDEPPPTAELKRLVHELQVHQIELEMQNEELHCTQSELEASRMRYITKPIDPENLVEALGAWAATASGSTPSKPA